MPKKQADKMNVSLLAVIDKPYDGDLHYAAMGAMLDELCGISERIPWDFANQGLVYPSISMLTTQARLSAVARILGKKAIQGRQVIEFFAEVPIVDFRDSDPNLISTNRLFAQIHARKRASDTFVLSNLSRPGSIAISSSASIIDGHLAEKNGLPRMYTWALQRAIDWSVGHQWPTIGAVPFLDVWTWVTSHVPDFFDGLSESPIGRSVSAFSRVFTFEPSDEALQLLWAMIGIESLYVRGKVSVMEQVREKIQAFLGIREANRKIISLMYENRSRFMHGDADFPSLCSIYDASPRVEQYMKREMETVEVAVAILTATLQELVRRNWAGLDFFYEVGNGGPKAS